ncbi:uncharacterized protein [Epargyreus clarus]
MWFMQSLEYTGSVSYYQFQDHDSKYFTQLIWAETESVGCGRAKFVVNDALIDRIVCNFSPKGNVYGKPVYAIGFPGTQCGNEMVPDGKFPGLCTQRHSVTKLTTPNLPVSSLLRILNLSNDSVKQEIDPLYNNIKQINRNLKEIEGPRHQIMRHVLRTKVKSRRTDSPYRQLNFWESPINVSKNHIDGHERGHSRMYHNHVFKFNDQPTKSGLMEDHKKYPLEISAINSQDNYRKSYFNKQCTRSTDGQESDCDHSSTIAYHLNDYKCTRGITSCKMVTQGIRTIPLLFNNHVVPQELCPCSTHRTTYPTTIPKNQHNLNCECENVEGVTIHCPNLIRTKGDREGNQRNPPDIYDNLYPNPNENNNWSRKKGHESKPYSKRSVGHSNRIVKKREFRDLSTFKPFWQIDSFINDRESQLKALRYTTLPSNRRPKAKKARFKTFGTESITIESKKSKINHGTEKYLSFDELLLLRKPNLNARRVNSPNSTEVTKTTTGTTKSTATTTSKATTKTTETMKTNIERTSDKVEEASEEYTTNTPFIRMKHCTRRLTCTWTAASATDNEGSIIPGAGGGHHGSRTPPGYVEGCTRTSTCTRDYMDRNIFPTLTTETAVAETEDEDESDYCERRSLNVQKRNSHRNKRFMLLNHRTLNKDTIKKRNGVDTSRCKSSTNKRKDSDISYGDLYYLVLNKIIEKWKNNRTSFTHNQCRCSKATKSQNLCTFLLFFLIDLLNFE